ncbi:TFIIS-type domain-containing protein [Meloidogyne graminicola]|uniref:TFIIS-type domain-containing protein n=1 Tax=Meloidogyne graminicola TaxID=189291 RepID=A0A8S9ZH72_9BILA|nr:TFIIS-type domain-containing protein [Meloidogyne graminicola]
MASGSFVGIKFCPEWYCLILIKIRFNSNNMLYPRENKEFRRLMYVCRNCEHSQIADNPCIYVNKLTHEVDELTQIVADVVHDPTLPRTEEHECPKCGKREAVFFQAQSRRAEEEMRLYFVCAGCHHLLMLKTRALDSFLGQVVGGAVAGIVLFNKDGLTVSRALDHSRGGGNVYSALLANIWETFERHDELKEVVIGCENGTVVLTRVASMLLAVLGTKDAPLGVLLVKLHALTIFFY